MRRPLVAGNWKMYGTCSSVAELVASISRQALPGDVDVMVIPPLLFVRDVVRELGGKVEVGAQNCAVRPGEGALTGEVSVQQLLDAGCKGVLVGHSERRQLLGESDEVVAAKYELARLAGLVPLLCVGETLEQRNAGETLDVVFAQIDAVIAVSGMQGLSEGVVAYEPVWAIGTGLTATPEQAQEVHAAIRAHVARQDAAVAEGLRIVYGGSVKAVNAAELFGMPDVDGGLVGGASLDANEFGAICRAAGN